MTTTITTEGLSFMNPIEDCKWKMRHVVCSICKESDSDYQNSPCFGHYIVCSECNEQMCRNCYDKINDRCSRCCETICMKHTKIVICIECEEECRFCESCKPKFKSCCKDE